MKDFLAGLLRKRHRLGVQLYLAIGGAVLLTMAASLVAWLSFGRVGEVQNEVNFGSIPEMASAFSLAQQSGNLVAAAPRLTVSTEEDFVAVSAQVADEKEIFQRQLDDLLGQVGGLQGVYGQVGESADMLLANLDEIESNARLLFEVDSQSLAMQAALLQLQFKLDSTLLAAIDEQLFYTMTGYRELGAPPDPREVHASDEQIRRYRYLSELQADTTLSTQLLANAFNVSEDALLEPLRERFEAAVSRMEISLQGLENDPWKMGASPTYQQLYELGLERPGRQNVFDLVARRIHLLERQSSLIQENRGIGAELVASVEGLVADAQSKAAAAADTSSQAIQTGRNLLLLVNVLSILGALIIAWLFVGRVLLNRLNWLSARMRSMAGGALQEPVVMRGQDEIAEMAGALEIFRAHALEVQRLNLVELLAEELQEKNAQLESVLADLQKAQDQIVMREKLAALGELTAGVAHEIRNPLNFIKNFAESSEELLEELQEELGDVLEGDEVELEEDQKQLLEELNDDLTDNLQRITSHSERANSIVQGMLRMGRGSGDLQNTDINKLLEENTRLAYHSARATDKDFMMRINMELDESVPRLQVVPQDLGRVFLNMVSNACHATRDRRNLESQSGNGEEPEEQYVPTLLVRTGLTPESFIVSIRDNGMGIPADVIEKIFNPFFTTKPTDQGTGLGLSMSSDIVRQHGGEIKVESEPGQFTELIVELPLSIAEGAEPEPSPG